jgi:hypothetical protein
MIRANELRIGNAVLYKNRTWIASEIYEHHIWLTDLDNAKIGYGIACEQISPIPLNPEILEACGFKSRPYNNNPAEEDDAAERGAEYFTDIDGPNCQLGIFINDFDKMNSGALLKDNNGYTISMGESPDFLHQLQNLYFALTASELPVNLQVKA